MSTKPQASKPQPKATPTARPAPAPAARPAAAKPAATDTQGSVRQTPDVDMSALQVERGVPRGQGRTRSEWAAKLTELLLFKDDSIFVPGKKSSQLSYVKKTAEKVGMTISIESVNNGARIFRDDGPEFVEGGENDDGLG